MPKDNYDNKIANIRDLIWGMVGQYPNLKFYERHMVAYVRVLELFPLDVVQRALPIAIQNRKGQGYGDTNFMPTAEHCRQACKIVQLQGEAAKPQEASEPKHELSPDNPFLKLANIWEGQSKELELSPDEEVPEELQKERFKNFWEIWKLSGLDG